MPMLNNVQYKLGMGSDPQGAKSFADGRGMVLMAWSPLGHGGRGSIPIFARDLPVEIGKAHGKSGAQVALKWILSHNVTLTTKSADPKHLAEDIDLFDWELTQAEVAALDEDRFGSTSYDTPSFLCNDPEPVPRAKAASNVAATTICVLGGILACIAIPGCVVL